MRFFFGLLGVVLGIWVIMFYAAVTGNWVGEFLQAQNLLEGMQGWYAALPPLARFGFNVLLLVSGLLLIQLQVFLRPIKGK